MANGETPEQIATELGMSKHTLRTHTQNVLTKLGVHSKLDAIVAAIRYGKVHTVDVTPAEELEEAEEGEDIHEIEDLGEVERAEPPEKT
jgi:hypothetical protein